MGTSSVTLYDFTSSLPFTLGLEFRMSRYHESYIFLSISAYTIPLSPYPY